MNQKQNKQQIRDPLIILIFILFIAASLWFDFKPGEIIYGNFKDFIIEMMKVLPCAFILIGLFDVWVKDTTIRNYTSGFRGYVFAILLASTTVGGLYVAFPFAHSLRKKGVQLSVVFVYIFAAGICRIPMTVFEASFLGLKFTLIRLAVSLPLVIGASLLLAGIFANKKN
ncbi:MAG: hypothetical protein GY754_41005 [bacterium]|nr:hypothetical protein [bacterium]